MSTPRGKSEEKSESGGLSEGLAATTRRHHAGMEATAMRALDRTAVPSPTQLQDAYELFRLERQGMLVTPRTVEFLRPPHRRVVRLARGMASRCSQTRVRQDRNYLAIGERIPTAEAVTGAPAGALGERIASRLPLPIRP